MEAERRAVGRGRRRGLAAVVGTLTLAGAVVLPGEGA
ncbi:pectin esterase, partial [Streptomyces sp. WAC05858]